MAADTHISRRNVHQPNKSYHFQTRCFLSRRSSATCMHSLSESVRHAIMDLAGTWRVSFLSLSFCLYHLFSHDVAAVIKDMKIGPINFSRVHRLELLWLTMTQFCTHCELEFLPVYVPTEEEKRNPRLFASNVRDVMAK